MLRWLILFPFLFIVVIPGYAQTPQLEWAGAFVEHNDGNPTTYSNGRTVGVDAQGNVYSAGLFMYTVDYKVKSQNDRRGRVY